MKIDISKLSASKSTLLGAIAGIFAAGLLFGWIIRGVATPPPDALTVASYGDWRLSCPPRTAAHEACQLTQNVVDQKSGTVVVRVKLWLEQNKPAMTVAVPFNVLIPSGMKLQIEGEAPQRYSYKYCDQSGCIASVSMDPELFRHTLNAGKLAVIVSSLSGSSVDFPLSTRGLRNGTHALNDAESGRHSWLWRTFL